MNPGKLITLSGLPFVGRSALLNATLTLLTESNGVVPCPSLKFSNHFKAEGNVQNIDKASASVMLLSYIQNTEAQVEYLLNQGVSVFAGEHCLDIMVRLINQDDKFPLGYATKLAELYLLEYNPTRPFVNVHLKPSDELLVLIDAPGDLEKVEKYRQTYESLLTGDSPLSSSFNHTYELELASGFDINEIAERIVTTVEGFL